MRFGVCVRVCACNICEFMCDSVWIFISKCVNISVCACVFYFE